MTRLRVLAASALVAVVTVSCGGTSEGPDADEPGEATATAAFADADVAFVLEGGAVLTSLLTTAQFAEGRSTDPDVARLAGDIARRTGPRVDAVAGWVRTWGEQGAELGHDAVPHPDGDGSGFSPEAVDRLHTVPARRFDAVFLPALVEHLERVEVVASEQVASGLHPGAVALAEKTAADAAGWLQEARRLSEGAR